MENLIFAEMLGNFQHSALHISTAELNTVYVKSAQLHSYPHKVGYVRSR
jgi:hypothetical protein